MRLKLSANSPLPPFKAWYPVHIQGSISSLKNTLCASLSVFYGLDPSSLQLSIDGFELLDSSDLSVLRDGDLVHVDLVDATSRCVLSTFVTPSVRGTRALHQPVPQSSARRDPGPSTSHKRKRRTSTPTSSSGSESETESTSASESDSDSDSDSGSESESDSDTSESGSESESSPPPIESLAKTALAIQRERERRQVKLPQQPKPQAVHPETFVPPGYGKPQTRARNLRRRLKRQHEHDAATPPSISGLVSGANAVAPGTEIVSQRETTTSAAPDAGWDANSALNLPSLSLRNKNKAKNFRSLIGKPLPPKIIFADEEGGVSCGSIGTPDPSKPAATADRQAVTQSHPRLIPPSSRSSLPSNLFVTSIDVEAGLRRNKKKRRMRVEYGDGFEEDHGEGIEEHGGDVLLDYGNADTDTMVVVPSKSEEREMDVDALESKANKQWTTLEKLTNKQQVVPGCVVAYMVLGINPVTCTPEFLPTLVGMQRLDEESILVRPLRPSAEISFGGPGPVGENEESVDDEAYSWRDVVNGDWRIVERV